MSSILIDSNLDLVNFLKTKITRNSEFPLHWLFQSKYLSPIKTLVLKNVAAYHAIFKFDTR